MIPAELLGALKDRAAGLVALLGPVFDPGYFFPLQALALLALCVVGAGLYFALAHLTGTQRLDVLFRRLRLAESA